MKPSRAEIQLIKSLEKRKFRESLSMFVVEGEKLVDEALQSDYEIERLYRKDDIGDEMMSRISHLSSPSPVLALVKIPPRVKSSGPQNDGLYLALDSVKDPGNLGTIIRLSEWFGIKGIYCSPDSVDMYNSKVVQATMGSIFRMSVSYTPLEELISNSLNKGIEVFGTFMDGDNIYSTSLPENALIVMGNESDGISGSVSSLIRHRLHIPNFSKQNRCSESLNVAVATAVICSEFRRFSV